MKHFVLINENRIKTKFWINKRLVSSNIDTEGKSVGRKEGRKIKYLNLHFSG